MRRITKAALGGLAGFALVVGATQGAAGAVESTYDFARRLIDVQLNPAASGPFDSARAKLWITETAEGSLFTIQVDGIVPDPLVPEPEGGFGAHLHDGPCVKEDFGGMKAGPHYQHDRNLGKAGINSKNEVWFNLVVNEGKATDETFVPFSVDPGAQMERSVVIHVGPTIKDPESTLVGTAGPRQACLPLRFDYTTQ